MKSSKISAKFLSLTPWYDFWLQYFEKRFVAKSSYKYELLAVVRPKSLKISLSTLKLPIYAKIVGFSCFSIGFYRKMG